MDQLFTHSTQILTQLLVNCISDALYILIDPDQLEQVNYHYLSLFKPYQIMLISPTISPQKFKTNATIIFISKNHLIPVITSIISTISAKLPSAQFHLFSTPKLSLTSDAFLRQHHVIDKILTFENVNFDISQSYDSNCFILSARNIEYDMSRFSINCVQEIAEIAFQTLKVLGGAKCIQARGKIAIQAGKSLERLVLEENLTFNKIKFEQVIFVDRLTDMLSVMVTGQSYMEQLDSHLKIQQNKVDNQPIYDCFDIVVQDCKYTHINNLGDKISILAKNAQAKVKECKEIQGDKSRPISEISQAFEGYKKAEAAAVFINEHTQRILKIQQSRNAVYCEEILLKKEILDSRGRGKTDLVFKQINSGKDLQTVLEYLSIISMSVGGLKAKDLFTIKKLITLTYGLQGLALLNQFQKLGLVTNTDQEQIYQDIFKEYHIVEQKDNEKIDYQQISYPFTGITPINVRNIQEMIFGSKDKKKQIGQWQGNVTYKKQLTTESPEKPKFLVFYIGPITHSELASIDVIRRQAQKTDPNFEIQIIASDLKTGKDIMKTICQVM
ncbi:Sec1 family protein [Spironucleus salmonicida]|uniref:Sec1 family protein n=2 Tax=Spironucleus TaxID=39709 RepID=V6LN20_9EUKA|nr:hypothetical protein [Spironucleus barkhanus]KAH0574472.1 Sec1 family protein [Spironucleus salmonicida]|eukprot:EST46020.1 Sec1 family protein [Spironucleus salmonicida]